jgi:RNA polymerase sigma-70 factor (ECF subfamily)
VVDQQGFASFFELEHPRLVLFLLKIGCGEADAEDAAQEAMLQAYLMWERITAPRAWVRTVAVRMYRNNAKRRRETPAVLDGMTPPAHDDPDKASAAEEELLVVTLLKCLPAQQRIVAALHYDGFAHDEIAAIIDRPTATVRSTLRHARTRLEEMIQSDATRNTESEP